MTERDKVTVNDIIGLVDCEPTNSVEEVKKLRGRENRTKKRYYYKDYEEAYYVFDSKTLSESEFEENVEYYGYNVFADSLTGEEVVDLLNELNNEINELRHKLSQQEMEYATTACRQAEENEELKDRIDNYNTAFKKLQDLTERKINENEQLKADKQALIDFIRKEFPKSHKHILEGFE